MPSLLDRLLGRDKEKEEKATQRVSEEAARKRREELAQKKKDMAEARLRAEKAEQQRLAALKEKEEVKEKAATEAPTMAALKEKEKTTAEARTYVVQSGDSLSKIAKELLGDAKRWSELYEANKELIGDDPNLIHPGQELTLP